MHALWHWLKHLDYGTVPAWVGTASALIAIRIFLRDRATVARAQVDVVGVWHKVTWIRAWLDDPTRVEKVDIKWFIRNGSILPVEVTQLSYEVHSKWLVRQEQDPLDQQLSVPCHIVEQGTRTTRMSMLPVRVPPQETWESQPQELDIGYMAPESASQLDYFNGVDCRIHWILITDNAGRRWEVRPSSGKRARRIKWWSKRRSGYPYEWKQTLLVRLRKMFYRLRDKLHKG